MWFYEIMKTLYIYLQKLLHHTKAGRYFKWIFSEFTHAGPNDGFSKLRKHQKAALVAALLFVNVWAVQVLNHEHWSAIYIQIAIASGFSHQRSVIMKSVPTVELSGGTFSDPMGWSPSICLWTGWEGTTAQQFSIPRWDLHGFTWKWTKLFHCYSWWRGMTGVRFFRTMRPITLRRLMSSCHWRALFQPTGFRWW